MKFYQGKVVALTGAGSGMGREMAKQLAAAGAKLALNDWSEDALSETRTALDIDDTMVLIRSFDVSHREKMYDFATAVVKQFGKVDIVINNAGIALAPKTIAQTEYVDFEKVVNINLWGMIYGTKAFLPYLRQRPKAAIANVSSVFGMMGYPGQGAYVTTKFAIRGFTETLRIELRNTNIAISSIHPGGIKTNIVRNIAINDEAKKQEMVKGFEELAPTTAAQAATIILTGIAKGKARILIGKDARAIDRMTRLFPSSYENTVLRGREIEGLLDED